MAFEPSDSTGHWVQTFRILARMPAVQGADLALSQLFDEGCLNEALTHFGVHEDPRSWDSGGVAPLNHRLPSGSLWCWGHGLDVAGNPLNPLLSKRATTNGFSI